MALPKPETPTYELNLPSTGKTIKFRPFLVKEEKILLLAEQSEDEKQILEAIKTIVKNCILTRIKIEDLTYFDLEYVFLQLRARSAEETLELMVTCKDDEQTQVSHIVNLLEIEVDTSGKSDKKIMLGKDSGIIMKYPSINEFVKFAIMGQNMKDPEVIDYVATLIDQIFTAEDVYDSEDQKQEELVEYLEGLTNKQFAKIGEFFTNIPTLKYTFSVTNPKTGVESEYTLEGLRNFFGN